MQMTPERWRYTSQYLREVFGREDAALAGIRARAEATGLPEIAISADVGRVLKLLVGFTPGRAALELGTLGGYSAAWISLGLAPEGRLLTIDNDAHHAEVARTSLAEAGLADRVEVQVADALEALERLGAERPPQSLDFVFFDAHKREYPEYFERVRPLIASGGLLVADNNIGSSQWWIDVEGHPDRDGADRLNRILAADEAFEAVGLPIREGLLVARRR